MCKCALCTVDDTCCFHDIRLGPKTSECEKHVSVKSTVTSCDVTYCATTLQGFNKQFAGWPAILKNLSASFPATLRRTSNLFYGQPRSHILRCPQSGVLFAVFLVLRGMALKTSWVLTKCSSCNRLHSLFA